MMLTKVSRVIILTILFVGSVYAAPPVTDGLIVELRADSLGDLANGAAVTYWPDTAQDDAIDGSVLDVGISTPEYVASMDELSGRPAVRFDGAQVLSSEPFDLDPAAGVTALAVFTGDKSATFHERLAHVGARTATGSTLIGLDVCTTSAGGGDDGSGFRLNNGRSLAIDPNPLANDTTNFHVGVWAAGQGMRHADLIYYVDGVQQTLTANNPNNTMNFQATDNDVTVGDGHNPAGNYYPGDYVTADLAAFMVYNRVLTADEIATMSEYLRAEFIDPPVKATSPQPIDGDPDVPPYTDLEWTPGTQSDSRNVYFGDDMAAVQDATENSPELVSLGQTATSFDPGQLELAKTYYWRVDEVAAGMVYKGDVWSFTVEPIAYEVQSVTVTTNLVPAEDQGPEHIVDGSGLDPAGLHETEATTMWAAAPDPNGYSYVEFELDRVYKLHEMKVWNHNSAFEMFLGMGIKDVTIETSTDGVDFTVLGDFELAQAPGTVGYAANSSVPLDGVAAKVVRLVINSTWNPDSTQVGLSEVRFMNLPVWSREPQPVDGATDVSVGSTLKWRASRSAVSHDVYLGTDANAVLDGDAPAGTVTEGELVPADLLLGTTYYWKVDEVNEADVVSPWEGDLWTFSTEAFVEIDGFESYTDDSDAGKAMWQSWIDGIEDTAMGGSQVGHTQTPFAESTIVHSGYQSMPFNFSNTDYSFSEATYTFDSAQDWTAHNIQSLVLYIYGTEGNVSGDLYVKINDTKVYVDVLADALERTQWVFCPIDLASTGADLANVSSLSIGIEGSGASGVIYVDDVRLYDEPAISVEPAVPDDSDASLAAYYEFEGDVSDAKGAYNCTVAGSPDYMAGLVGQAISLNGVNDSVVCAFTEEVVWPAYSVSLWAKAGSLAQPLYGSVFNNNSSASDFQLDVDGTDPGNYRYHGSIDADFGAVTTEWVHLAIACDGAETSLYYNGLWAGTYDMADTNFGQIAFGVNRAGDVWYQGLVDEARLYDRALSQGEMAGLAGITESVFEPF